VDVPNLSGLNMNSLDHLQLIEADEKISLVLMDLALRSSSSHLTLTIETDIELGKALLGHDIMKRVTNLRISRRGIHSFLESFKEPFIAFSSVNDPPIDPLVAQHPEGLKISFPRLLTCDISQYPSILSVIDMGSARTLHLRGIPPLHILHTLDPNRLTTLSVFKSYFRTTRESKYRIPCLLALTSLEIQATRVYGNLDQYFLFPNLKQLRLCGVAFVEGDQSNGYTEVKPLESGISEDIGNLEGLFLENLKIDDGFPAILCRCPRLQQLNLEYCTMDSFFPPFIEYIKNDVNYLPNLRSCLLDRWRGNSGMKVKDLRQVCAIERSGLHIYDTDASSATTRHSRLIRIGDRE
jgi:hypothetical protein